MSNQYIWVIDEAKGQDGWIFATSPQMFIDQDRAEVHKHANKELGQFNFQPYWPNKLGH